MAWVKFEKNLFIQDSLVLKMKIASFTLITSEEDILIYLTVCQQLWALIERSVFPAIPFIYCHAILIVALVSLPTWIIQMYYVYMLYVDGHGLKWNELVAELRKAHRGNLCIWDEISCSQNLDWLQVSLKWIATGVVAQSLVC